MSHLQDLIDGASGDAPVSALLRKVKVVAARAEVAALDEWVQHELDGYPNAAELPEYRGPFQVEVLGTFGGFGGSALKNAPIPSVNFPEEFRDGPLFQIAFLQPIAEIEELARGGGPLNSPWEANAIAYVNGLLQSGKMQLYEGMGLQQAWRQVSQPQVASVVDAVRNRILDLALTLERSNPDAGQPDAPPLAAEDRQLIVTNIYGSSNVAVGSTNVTQDLEVGTGDQDALRDALTSVGVPETDIEELFAALESDGEVDEQMGPATATWYGDLMARATDLGIGAAGGAIAQAIAHYLGIG